MVEGSADFYTSRIPKRQRKNNLIDELLSDAEFRRYDQHYEIVVTVCLVQLSKMF